MISVQRLSKKYQLYNHPMDRIREALSIRGNVRHVDFWALRNVSFEMETGEVVGLIGPNGCGKSTLLQIVGGILQPSEGRVLTRGRIAALLELGAGFNPEFTGRENVYLNGEILGLSRLEISRKFAEIAAFAEIGDFIDRPVKEYSSGMYVRLAFSTAIHVDPEILLVDEALAVGDAAFSNRCIRKFEELRRRNISVLFVSHDLGLVKQLAQRAILLMHGTVVMDGTANEAINRYVGLVLERTSNGRSALGGGVASAKNRHGDGTSRIIEVSVLDGEAQPTNVIQAGDQVTVRIVAEFSRPVKDPMVGILIRTRIGVEVFGTNTKLEQVPLGSYNPGDRLEISCRFECRLTPQEYTLTVAIQHTDGASHDWLDDVMTFQVVGTKLSAGLVDLSPKFDWKRFPSQER